MDNQNKSFSLILEQRFEEIKEMEKQREEEKLNLISEQWKQK